MTKNWQLHQETTFFSANNHSQLGLNLRREQIFAAPTCVRWMLYGSQWVCC